LLNAAEEAPPPEPPDAPVVGEVVLSESEPPPPPPIDTTPLKVELEPFDPLKELDVDPDPPEPTVNKCLTLVGNNIDVSAAEFPPLV
jgi:hypothetical protein